MYLFNVQPVRILSFLLLFSILGCSSIISSKSYIDEIVIINIKKLDRLAIAQLIEYSSEAKVVGIDINFTKPTEKDQSFLKIINAYQHKLVFSAAPYKCITEKSPAQCDSLKNTFFHSSDTHIGFTDLFFPPSIDPDKKEPIFQDEYLLYKGDTIPHFGVEVVRLYSNLPIDKFKLGEQVKTIYPQKEFMVIDGTQLLKNPSMYSSVFKDKIVLISFLGEEVGSKPAFPETEEGYYPDQEMYYIVILASHIVHLLKEYEVPIISEE
ncbi:MAG: CHASE2 domain-containing protein [Thermonemataceae bacterium]